ncbi:helix-turn-helix domain-containing protein [Flavobacterium sp. DSR3-2]|uniref:helix-turn-helix domain-containing protein n=1 Tax=Flavobacterium sp. DSR3-2 TaxID=2804634 RepID=UPI003CF51D49
MNDTPYINWIAMSDTALAQNIGAFVKHHRLSQNKTQEEVAGAANISRSTLSLLEKGETITVPTLIQVLRVLDLLYIMDVFKIQEQISPIELAKLDQQKRQRARSSDNDSNKKSDW